jgi:hypothetical protein
VDNFSYGVPGYPQPDASGIRIDLICWSQVNIWSQ